MLHYKISYYIIPMDIIIQHTTTLVAKIFLNIIVKLVSSDGASAVRLDG